MENGYEAGAAGGQCGRDARSIRCHRDCPHFKTGLLHETLWPSQGGEMLTEWNRLGFQIAGAVFAGFAIYLLYVFFRR